MNSHLQNLFQGKKRKKKLLKRIINNNIRFDPNANEKINSKVNILNKLELFFFFIMVILLILINMKKFIIFKIFYFN